MKMGERRVKQFSNIFYNIINKFMQSRSGFKVKKRISYYRDNIGGKNEGSI